MNFEFFFFQEKIKLQQIRQAVQMYLAKLIPVIIIDLI